MRSSNPFLRDGVSVNTFALNDRPMSLNGTLNKLLILSLVMIAAAAAVFYQFSMKHFDYVNIMLIVGVIVGIISVVVIAFNHKSTPYLAPVYAFSQGAVLSAISCSMEASFPGIVVQAISMTFIVVFTMALLYRMKLIRATERFKAVLFTATAAIAVFYIVTFIMFLFHLNVPYFATNSSLTIGINIGIALIAALNLIIDFDFIEKGINAPLPSLYEWYGAFGLMVTILWLYVEILRLLSRLRSR